MTEPVPDEYGDTVAVGADCLLKGAALVMWVAKMLGNDKFELDTGDGYKIVISKNDDPITVNAEKILIPQY